MFWIKVLASGGICVVVSALSPSGCVTLSKLLEFSVPQCSLRENGDNGIYCTRLL